MNARMTAVTAALSLFAGTTLAAEANVGIGTWTLNESKSKIPAGVGKNTTVIYEQVGDSLKAMVDGVDAEGKSTHNEWTGKPDGKPYPVTGDPATDMRSLKRKDDRHYDLKTMKDGKPVATGTIVYSKDFKTRTLTVHGKDAKRKKTTAVYVYEKQ